MVEIKGIEKFASRDFPGHISSTVFLGGCPFRCPYCHNVDLVLHQDEMETIPIDIFLSFLDGRKGWLEAICISGGEPLLHVDIEDLIRGIRDRGLLVKLDTNGAFPARLERLLRDGLLDFVAMDVKAPLERYCEVTGASVDIKAIEKSADLLGNSGIPAVFRTTMVPDLVGIDDVVKIGQWLRGSGSYVVQQFHPRNTIDPAFSEKKPYSRGQLETMVEAAKPYFQSVRLENP